MDTKILGLLITLLLGMFILIGCVISFTSKNEKKYTDFSIALAFGVIIMLIFTDLLPEAAHSLELKNIWIFICFTFLGYILLTGLDHFIPDHEESKMTKKEETDNLVHIGLLSSIALVIHNIIEGMAIYSSVFVSSNLAIMMSLGVGFHNIPLGMVIASTLYQSNKSKTKTLIVILGLAISTFIGGIVMMLLGNVLNEFVIGILLSITIGMLIFISVNELFPRIKSSKNKKITMIGIITGVVLMIISKFIG